MRRLFVANLLVFAVLASAAALAYYGWSYTAEVSSRQQAAVEEAMREVAKEKIFGIETVVFEPEDGVFRSIDLDRLFELEAIIKREKAIVRSVFVLDTNLQLVNSGFLSSLPAKEASEFRERFVTTILPTLAPQLRQLAVGARARVHGRWHGEELLLSFTKQVDAGREFFVVLDTDLVHVVLHVCPQFFDIPSNQLYQVVDGDDVTVCGRPYRSEVVVDVPFTGTFDLWRLRVAPSEIRDDTGARRQLIDIVLIGVALAGIVAGLGILLVAMRRERKANELKSDFISNVSHELKTPLSIISMFGEMLASGRVKTSAQATEYAEIIWRESVRLARLIDNVLDFAKIERGKDVYEFAEGDVADVVVRAIELSSHRLQKAELAVDTELDPDLPLAGIDANALTLAVMNLIDNAIKYAADGRRLVIRVRGEGERIVVEVQDFGAGIDPAEHDRIFERFYRARAVRLTPIRGSGIGLALVDHIARAHGGGVSVTSAPGEGSTFALWIPAVARAEHAEPIDTETVV